MKNLIIITHNIYDGNWLIDELKFHNEMEYDKILVFNTKELILPNSLGNKVTPFILKYHRDELVLSIIKSLFNSKFLKEILVIIKRSGKKKLQCMIKALLSIATADVYAKYIERTLKEYRILNESNIFYAYWMSVQAEVFLLLSKKCRHSIFISRCHSIDLYEERDKTGYLEYRQQLINLIDKIYCISLDGKKYLEERYNCGLKCNIARLGSNNNGLFITQGKSDSKVFKLVTCSSLLTVKRLHLVIEILSHIKDVEIIWHHYGTGPLLETLEQKAKKLPTNIAYEFKGYYNHTDLFENYAKEKYDLLLNVSYIEGIPVSMMEAISMGIPIVGTNVGGVSEIVKDGYTGLLIDRDSTIEEMVKCLYYFINMDDSSYATMRKNCVEFWKHNYDCEKNYKLFSEDIYRLKYPKGNSN